MAKERITPAQEDIAEELLSALQNNAVSALAKLMHNDLEYALFDKFPLLEVLRQDLTLSGALRVMVSGSGSSIIALFPDKEARQQAAEKIKELLDDPVSAVFELGE